MKGRERIDDQGLHLGWWPNMIGCKEDFIDFPQS